MVAPSLTVTASAPSTPVAPPWIVGRGFDMGFFLLSGLVVFIPWIASSYFAAPAGLILAAVAVVSNGPHLGSTWTRVYLDQNELRRRPMAYAGIPVLICAVVAGLIWTTPLAYRILCSVILYTATYHFAAQCYGILRLYQRKSASGLQPEHRFESIFIYATAIAGLSYRLHHGPRTVFDIEVYAPPVPLSIVLFAGGIAAGCLAVIIRDQVRRARDGERVPWERLAFLAAVTSGFLVPFVLVQDGTAGFAAAACWHGIQYLGIVYYFNTKKFSGQSPEGARLIAWVSQPGRAFHYGALLMVMIGLVYASTFAIAGVTTIDIRNLGLATWVSLTLAHYWVDGLIWKIRRDQTNRRLLAA